MAGLTIAQQQLVRELHAAAARKGRPLTVQDWRRRASELGLPRWWDLHEHFDSIRDALAIAHDAEAISA